MCSRLTTFPSALLLCAALPLAVLDTGCAPDVVVHTAENPGASFERYQTFAFGPAEGPPQGYEVSARSAEVRRRLEPMIAAALIQRGYVPANGKGDLFIMFGSGRRAVEMHTTSAVAEEWLPDDESSDFVEGSVVVDAFDGASGGRVWHGASRSEIDPDHIDNALLQRTVDKLLASFPHPKAGAP